MNDKKCLTRGLEAVGIGALTAGITTGLSAASGAAGAALLNFSSYHAAATNGAIIGAVGGAIMGTATGVVAGALIQHGMFSRLLPTNCTKQLMGLVGYMACITTSGVIGHEVMKAAGGSEAIDIAQTAADFALGGCLSWWFVSAYLLCKVPKPTREIEPAVALAV